ncbi:hypothetical protein R3P38DRAFT_3241830 [Favolaschia claudopus]|uniref:Uncharacterized protein n=1 Tax=Favolaschia claudopus TaxID=2862362 RepID=A0AAV9Z5P0_9AGAR
MTKIPASETSRLFGPSNRPHKDTNVFHQAILRKAIEFFSSEYLEETFGRRPFNLRVKMGTGATANEFGKIYKTFLDTTTGRRITQITDPPTPEQLVHLRSYCDRLGAYFMKQGNEYAVRNPQRKDELQEEEQNWNDWIVLYNTVRGRPTLRPPWALEPLPGLRRVNVVLARAPRRIAPLPRQTRRALVTPALRAPFSELPAHPLPTPPPTSPAPSNPSQFREIIEISDDEEEFPARLPIPDPPSTSRTPREIIDISDDEGEGAEERSSRIITRTGIKRHLGTVVISDDEDEGPPAKRMKFCGFIDLTRN